MTKELMRLEERVEELEALVEEAFKEGMLAGESTSYSLNTAWEFSAARAALTEKGTKR